MREIIVNENPSWRYVPRTILNGQSADITLAFATDFTTAGEKTTKSNAKRFHGVDLLNTVEHEFTHLLQTLIAKNTGNFVLNTINVAGNGIYKLDKKGVTQGDVNFYVATFIKNLHKLSPISKIYSGAQTGADMAGVYAGWRLGIPVEINIPKGYRQRNKDGIDFYHGTELKFMQYLEEFLNWESNIHKTH